MAGEEMMEGRLREMLRDPGWTLPAWPDAEARIRRVARRQRIRAATAGAAMAGIVAAVVASVTGFQSPGVLGRYDPATASVALPGPGAAGFPASIYPPALPGLAGGLLTRCPDPGGLAAPSPAAAARATAVVASLDAVSFRTVLQHSDRAYWPQEQADRRHRSASRQRSGRVVYSGPLATAPLRAGGQSAALGRDVRISCGDRTAGDTWLVITAAPGRSAGQSEYLLLDRRGHLLVWNAS